MFTHSKDLQVARENLVAQMSQPKKGTILRGLNGLPIRVRCQVRQRQGCTETEIFSYATLIAAAGVFESVKGQSHVVRDFASSEYHGSKAILLTNARNQLLARYADEPILRSCDVLPVKSLRVMEIALSKRSVTCEIAEFCSEEESDLCAALVLETEQAAAQGRDLAEVLAMFYSEFTKIGTKS